MTTNAVKAGDRVSADAVQTGFTFIGGDGLTYTVTERTNIVEDDTQARWIAITFIGPDGTEYVRDLADMIKQPRAFTYLVNGEIVNGEEIELRREARITELEKSLDDAYSILKMYKETAYGVGPGRVINRVHTAPNHRVDVKAVRARALTNVEAIKAEIDGIYAELIALEAEKEVA